MRKLVIVTVAGLFLVHASPQASAQEATAVLLRIARSLTTESVPRPRFARLGPGGGLADGAGPWQTATDPGRQWRASRSDSHNADRARQRQDQRCSNQRNAFAAVW